MRILYLLYGGPSSWKTAPPVLIRDPLSLPEDLLLLRTAFESDKVPWEAIYKNPQPPTSDSIFDISVAELCSSKQIVRYGITYK